MDRAVQGGRPACDEGETVRPVRWHGKHGVYRLRREFDGKTGRTAELIGPDGFVHFALMTELRELTRAERSRLERSER